MLMTFLDNIILAHEIEEQKLRKNIEALKERPIKGAGVIHRVKSG
jgi:hypothetical protein